MYQVYLVRNLINKKCYVGFTKQGIKDRWCKHKTRTAQSALKTAIDEFGEDNFIIEVLEEHTDLLDAMIAELTKIREYNCLYPYGYNTLYTSYSSAKISRSQRDKSKTAEHKIHISIGLTGLKQSKETVEKRILHFYTPIQDQYGNKYNSVTDASCKLGIPQPSISHILVGRVKSPRHGYLFSYVKEEAAS